MSARDSSEPAFPGQYVKHPAGEVGNNVAIMEVGSGLSKREYFAARAPEAPDWFRFTPEEGRPPQVELPDPEKELNTWEQEELRVWKDGEGMDFTKLSTNVRAFMLRYQKAHQANERFQHWRMKNREAKYWSWRFYYADQMIERSAK